MTAQETLEAIFSDLEKRRDNAIQGDDITCVVVRREKEEAA